LIEFNPRPYQNEIIDHVMCHPRSAVWAGMGMGKTSATLTAIRDEHLLVGGPTLVIAPLRVAQSTWPDEIAKWDHLHDMTVSPIVGDLKARRAALKRKADIYTTNYEQLPWLVEQCKDDWPFNIVVADESTKLKNFRVRQGGKRAKALAQVAHNKTSRFIELTGTPSPNGLMDLWGQMWFLDAGHRLGRSFSSFVDRWFRPVRVGADPHAVQYVAHKFAQDEIQSRLSDLCLSINAKDYLDINEPIMNTIFVDLPSKARSQYEELEREMFLSIDETEIEVFNAAARTTKCLQLANGAIYKDETRKTFLEVHNAKLDALDSVVSESGGMPVLVAYHFKSDLKRLTKAFPTGRVLDKDPQTIRDWNAGKIPILFAHPASAGHGINLQDGGNILVFFGHWWNLEEYQQIIERIGPMRQIQAGHDRPVFIHHIVARGTIDEQIMERRISKRAIQDLLLDAMKRKRS
jgi:SNF2 family DNA or RNA helicase